MTKDHFIPETQPAFREVTMAHQSIVEVAPGHDTLLSQEQLRSQGESVQNTLFSLKKITKLGKKQYGHNLKLVLEK